MTVYELNRDQLEELKQHYLTENMDEQGYGISYDVLANADDIISDERIFEIYEGVDFVPDDFFCSAGQEEEHDSLEDRLLAIEARVRFIQDHGYIPWVSPYPSSTEKQLVDWVQKAANCLNMAANCAHLLRY